MEKIIGKDFMLHLDFRVEDCTAEAWLNDIPLKMLAHGETFSSFPIHEYLIKGQNHLELVINPNPRASKCRSPFKQTPAVGKASVRLVAYKEGMIVNDPEAKEVSSIVWSARESESKDFTQVKQVQFNCEFLGDWSWGKSQKIDLEKERPAIIEYLSHLHSSFIKFDAEPFLKSSVLRLKEQAIAYPHSSYETKLAFCRADFDDFKEMSKDFEITFKPFKSNMVDLRLCAEEKLVECIDINRIPLLYAESDDDDIFEYHVFLGKVDGNYQILRAL